MLSGVTLEANYLPFSTRKSNKNMHCVFEALGMVNALWEALLEEKLCTSACQSIWVFVDIAFAFPKSLNMLMKWLTKSSECVDWYKEDKDGICGT